MSNTPANIPLAQIDTNPVGIQPRAALNQDAVERYANDLSEGKVLPAVELMQIDGEDKYRIIDGFHRTAAAKQAGKRTVRAIVRKGTVLTARELALELNARHGVPISTAERKAALLGLLDQYEAEGINRSIAEIAGTVGMPKTTVHRIIQSRKAPEPKGDLSTPLDEPKSPPAGLKQRSDRSNGTVVHNDPAPNVDNDTPPAPGEVVLHDSALSINDLNTHVNMSLRKLRAMDGDPGCGAINRHKMQLERALSDVAGVIKACTPVAVCPSCDGKGGSCVVCKGDQVVCAEQQKQLAEDSKTGLRPRTPKPSAGSDW